MPKTPAEYLRVLDSILIPIDGSASPIGGDKSGDSAKRKRAWENLRTLLSALADVVEAAANSRCHLCQVGFPKKNGIHYPTQSLGMIPETPCLVDANTRLAAAVAGVDQ